MLVHRKCVAMLSRCNTNLIQRIKCVQYLFYIQIYYSRIHYRLCGVWLVVTSARESHVMHVLHTSRSLYCNYCFVVSFKVDWCLLTLSISILFCPCVSHVFCVSFFSSFDLSQMHYVYPCLLINRQSWELHSVLQKILKDAAIDNFTNFIIAVPNIGIWG